MQKLHLNIPEVTPDTDLSDIANYLQNLIELVTAGNLSKKEVLNTTEVSRYTGHPLSQIYKFTSARAIPFYSPRGKNLFFKRTEIDDWLLKNRVKTLAEIETDAANHLTTGGGR